jgi:predicted alpha/beta superfamily hydrolase
MNLLRHCTLLAVSMLALLIVAHAQDVTVRLAVVDTLRSERLAETRRLLVHLPDGYDGTTAPYPVIYLLDGTPVSLLEAVAAMNKLRSDRFAPDVIIVAIENVDRDRDMMPLSTAQYPVAAPGADRFLGFIANELIPHVDRTYRTTEQRILVGRSLSGLFTAHALLTRPELFDGYIGRSAGWLGDMNEFFSASIDQAFQQPDRYQGTSIFMSMSLMDSFDPDQTIHRQMVDFSDRLRARLGERVRYTYVTYATHPHVPYPSLYDGLRFVFGSSTTN